MALQVRQQVRRALHFVKHRALRKARQEAVRVGQRNAACV